MLKDKSLSLMLMVMFGIAGVTVLILAWLSPVLASDRFTATVAGSLGLFVSVIQIPAFRRKDDKNSDGLVPVEVEVEEKS